jgi:hypothetical protein
VVGCASTDYGRPLDAQTALDSTRAYIYGRFRLIGDSSPLGSDPLFLLELTEVAIGSQVNLRFTRGDNDVYAVAVAPGDYRVTGTVIGRRAVELGIKEQRRAITLRRPLNTSFSVERGKAYYVGDYVAFLTIDRDFYVVATRTRWRWELREASLKFAETTIDLKEKFPAFRSVELLAAWPQP